jgi:hypothetical protein
VIAITRCLNIQPSANLQALYLASTQQEAEKKILNQHYAINTYVHIIADGTLNEISDDQVASQMAILNARFKGSSCEFRFQCLTSISEIYTLNLGKLMTTVSSNLLQ